MPVPRSLACVRLVVLPLALLPSACSISNADGDCNTENNCNYVVSSSAPSSTTPTDPTSSSTTTTTTTTTMGGTLSGSESDGSTDGSTVSTTTSGTVCGNGEVEAGEECDDGNKTPGDGCESDCKLPRPNCGDGKVDPGEECDDGNTENTDACVACKMATCGDGAAWTGQEVCDAGEDNGMYNSPCAADCQGPGPFCGDMKKNGPEECDDGQVDPMQDGYDDCSNDCLMPRYVFVTSPLYDGQFADGIAGADEFCVTLGDQVEKGTTWKAWLSDDTTWPAKRMDTTFKGYYRRPDGMPVAKGWADLVDGTNLLNPINIMADNVKAMGTLTAWTGTTATGTTSNDRCNNWMDMASETMGQVGAVGAVTSQWTDQALKECNAQFRLYCFED